MYIGIIEIEEVIEKQIWGFNGEDIIVCDNGLKFTAVAARCGQMLNVAEIARDADINQVQAKSWLAILETLGIIFYLYPYSNNF